MQFGPLSLNPVIRSGDACGSEVSIDHRCRPLIGYPGITAKATEECRRSKRNRWRSYHGAGGEIPRIRCSGGPQGIA